MALVRLFLDTGARRSELASLNVADVDWDINVVVAQGKGGRERPCAFGRKTAQSLDRYIRARSHHTAPSPWQCAAAPCYGQGPRPDCGTHGGPTPNRTTQPRTADHGCSTASTDPLGPLLSADRCLGQAVPLSL